MPNPDRLLELAQAATVYRKERLPTAQQYRDESIAASAVDQGEAKQHLKLQRTNSGFYTDPLKKKRNVFMSKAKKAALAEQEELTYTKAEKFSVLDHLINEGCTVGVAQSIFEVSPLDPLDVNVCYNVGPDGQTVATSENNGWLDLIAKRNGPNDVALIRLIVGYGSSQATIDHALSVALERGAMETAQELFRNKADPNKDGVVDQFLYAIRERNEQLYSMFLTAPVALDLYYINQALVEAVRQGTDLVALLIAHGADGMWSEGEALRLAISMNHKDQVAMILTNPQAVLSTSILDLAVTTASDLEDIDSKCWFMDILLSAGASTNTPKLKNELFNAVRNSIKPLVELLVYHGTTDDSGGADDLRTATISGQAGLVRTLLQGQSSEAGRSEALEAAYTLKDLNAYGDIVKSLVEKGVPQNALSRCLAESIDKGCFSLVPFLIEKGASLEYDDARCVRAALSLANLALFSKLLEAPCPPAILSNVITDAMKIQDSASRLDVMVRLLSRGVTGKPLHVALQSAVGSTNERADYSLIEVLMKYNASVDYTDENGNCLCTATALQDERALDLLIAGNPSPNTISAAIRLLRVSFAKSETSDYERQIRMMSILLERGASGDPVNELLVAAARDDHREKALTTLIQYGADVNYNNGEAIAEALRSPRITALELLCKGAREIKRDTFVAQIPIALETAGFDLEKASLLAHAAQAAGHEDILDERLVDEVATHGARADVLDLLLKLGANVNFEQAKALQHSVSAGDVKTCNLLLAAGVDERHLSSVFLLTGGIEDRQKRYNVMAALLKVAPSKIGQDQALIQASFEAVSYDFAHVELLLRYKASPDFENGAAVLKSIETRNIPLLKRFIQLRLSNETLANAFKLARSTDCTPHERYDIFEILLGEYPDKASAGLALVEAVKRDPADTATSSLLLNYGASIESQNGLAMQTAASRGSIDQLIILLSANPSQGCIDAGFYSAINSNLEPGLRRATYQCFLDTGVSQQLISSALLQATKEEVIDQALLSLLIAFKASLDFTAGKALHNVVAKADHEALATMLEGDISKKSTLDKSFGAAMKLKSPERFAITKKLLEKSPGVSSEAISSHLSRAVKEQDYELLNLAMDYQPELGVNARGSLIVAAQAGDVKAAEILSRGKVHGDVVNGAFESLLDSRAIRSTPGGLRTAEMLLGLGVKQDLIDRAFLDAFFDEIDQRTKDLVDLLLPYNPDVSGDNCKVFVVTSKSGETGLFGQLALQRPDLNIAIPALIDAFDDEQELLPFLGYLEMSSDREERQLQDSVIFHGLAKFPNGRNLIRHLLDYGCPVDSKIDCPLGELSDGTEQMTALIWALGCADPIISEEVIYEILADGRNIDVSFTTPLTQTSASLAAALMGKTEILKRLIALGINPSHRDQEGRTALFHASNKGHLACAEALVLAGCEANDGSLHEAAREAHPQLVEFLLKNGHSAEFPSTLHADGEFGRTPLEELCLKAQPGTGDWSNRLYESIKLLLPTQIENVTDSGGKTMLHLAIENDNAVDVVQELLKFPVVWEHINDPIYQYEDDQGYVYSPTKYVELIYDYDDPETCDDLAGLLRARRCTDRFYSNTVDQPLGAIGLPRDVAEAVNKQKRADHEQREALKRLDEIAAHQQAIEAEEHRRALVLAEERQEQAMRQLKEREETEKQMAEARQATELSHARQLQHEREEAITAENRMRLAAIEEENAVRKRNREMERQAELAHIKELETEQNRALQSKIELEQRIAQHRIENRIETASVRQEYQMPTMQAPLRRDTFEKLRTPSRGQSASSGK